MRFLRQISEGEVLIEDNEVRPQTAAADARADAWVNEFTAPSLQVPGASPSSLVGGNHIHSCAVPSFPNEISPSVPDPARRGG